MVPACLQLFYRAILHMGFFEDHILYVKCLEARLRGMVYSYPLVVAKSNYYQDRISHD